VEWLEWSRGPIHVPRFLKQGELITIVQKPIEAVGLRFEEGLVETIVKDTLESSSEAEEGGQVGRSAVLPLLEFALTELWERRQHSLLTHEAYHSIGGVVGALPQWADRAFYALKPSERRLAQRILTGLVHIGDKSQGILDSRRRRTMASLYQIADEQESVERVVQHLVANRLYQIRLITVHSCNSELASQAGCVSQMYGNHQDLISVSEVGFLQLSGMNSLSYLG